MAKHEFRIIQGCPCPKNIAPYIAIVLSDSKAKLNSCYRGEDARALLNAHGHKSQGQLYSDFVNHVPGALPANKPGFSTHELKSDNVAYKRFNSGADLPWWAQGFDVNDQDVPKVINAGKKYGWQIFQPYQSGSEFHHLNFRVEPKPTLRTRLNIIRLRTTLPKK